MTEPKFKLNVSIEDLEKRKDKEEIARFLGTFLTMEQYSQEAQRAVAKIKRDFESIDKRFLAKMTYSYKERIQRLNDAIALNQKFLNEVIAKYKPPQEVYDKYSILKADIQDWATYESSFLGFAIFMYIVRDWSQESTGERDVHYETILNEIKSSLTDKSKKYKIFIPGAGACRLAYEVAKLGHDVECNDYNFLNCFFVDFIINHCKQNEFTFQPLIRSFTNYLTEDIVFKKFSFPNTQIDLSNAGNIVMTGGDFTVLYGEDRELYDCVVTCFFIDTGKNVIEYVDIIHNVLKKGGLWINFGPLSYHFTGQEDSISIDLPYDKLKEVILNYGFEYTKEEHKEVQYCEVEDHMMASTYNCIYFTAVKK